MLYQEDKLYATGIERCFIACLMRFPMLVVSAEASIKPEDIYSPNFNIIYRVILKMKANYDLKREPYIFSQELLSRWIDTCTDNEKMIIERTISRFSHLTTIQNAPGVDIESFHKYIKMLKETSVIVKMFRLSQKLQARIMEPSSIIKPDEVLKEAKGMFSDVNSLEKDSDIVRMGDCINVLKAEAEFNKNNKHKVGIWIPRFEKLMKVINGIRRSQFIILFARPKTGKSSLLLNVALDSAFQNIPTLYIDTEMTQKEQASRALSNWSGIKEWDIMGGNYLEDEEKVKTINQVGEKLREAPLYYVAARGGNIDTICGYIREFVDKYVGKEDTPSGPRTRDCLVVYDWLKVADSDSLKQVKEYQELGFLATALNDVRRELDIPLIAGAQANRFGNEKGVGLDSAFNAQNFLADSDRLLRFCTCLIWLRRLNYEETVLMNEYAEVNPESSYNQMIHVVDQRGGPVCLGGIGLNFNGSTLSYEEKDPIDLTKIKQGKKKRTKEEKISAISDASEIIMEEDEKSDDPF